MSHLRTTLWHDIRGHVALLGILILIALFIGVKSDSQAFVSSELAFTDTSISGIEIVPASCPSSPHYAGECTSIIIIQTCPAGQHRNVSQACVCDSTNAAPVNGQCAAPSPSCPAPTYFCGTGADENNLYYRTYSGNSCSVQSSLYARCYYGCNTATAACFETPGTPAAGITVRPTLVRSGDTVVVEWHTTDALSCAVTGTNGDSWTGRNISYTSGAITAQTTYTLTCTMRSGPVLTDAATVNIIPVFNEN